jgi:hypothetical protein
VRLTEEQYTALQAKAHEPVDNRFHDYPKRRPRPNTVLISEAAARTINRKAKFKNIRTEQDGVTHDSGWEAERFQQLKLMEKAGEIRDLRHHVGFPLLVGDELVGSYEADAVYFDQRLNRKIVEDAKGCRTPLYRWKARHFKAQYGFSITEVKRP